MDVNRQKTAHHSNLLHRGKSSSYRTFNALAEIIGSAADRAEARG